MDSAEKDRCIKTVQSTRQLITIRYLRYRTGDWCLPSDVCSCPRYVPKGVRRKGSRGCSPMTQLLNHKQLQSHQSHLASIACGSFLPDRHKPHVQNLSANTTSPGSLAWKRLRATPNIRHQLPKEARAFDISACPVCPASTLAICRDVRPSQNVRPETREFLPRQPSFASIPIRAREHATLEIPEVPHKLALPPLLPTKSQQKMIWPFPCTQERNQLPRVEERERAPAPRPKNPTLRLRLASRAPQGLKPTSCTSGTLSSMKAT